MLHTVMTAAGGTDVHFAGRFATRRPFPVSTLTRRGPGRIPKDDARDLVAGAAAVPPIDPVAAANAAVIAAMDRSLPGRLVFAVGDRLGAALAPLVDLEVCRAAARVRIARSGA